MKRIALVAAVLVLAACVDPRLAGPLHLLAEGGAGRHDFAFIDADKGVADAKAALKPQLEALHAATKAALARKK